MLIFSTSYTAAEDTHLEGLVLLNIQSWAEGADRWGTTGSEVGGRGHRLVSSISRSRVDYNCTKF